MIQAQDFGMMAYLLSALLSAGMHIHDHGDVVVAVPVLDTEVWGFQKLLEWAEKKTRKVAGTDFLQGGERAPLAMKHMLQIGL